MTEQLFRVESLGKHDRKNFTCGEPALDEYFRRQASQDVRRRVTACFVIVAEQTGLVAGYYTLAACHMQLEDIAEEWRRKLPRYSNVPAVQLGRLGIDLAFQGLGVGGILISDAARRALRAEIAAHMMVVDAKSENAAAFYRHHGFRSIGDLPLRLCAPLETIIKDAP